MRKVIIRESDGFVENTIEIEDGSNWQLPEDCYLIDALDGSPDDTWDGKKFVKPPYVEPKPPRDLTADLITLEKRVKILEKRR